MPEEDRTKWDTKYQQQDHLSSDPSALLVQLEDILPRSGKALDVAGGAGRHAVWLAQRGLDVTLADISQVGLDIAAKRALAAEVQIKTLLIDLETESFPIGPWDLIVSCDFLWRPLFKVFSTELVSGGMLIVSQPTYTNLQRHQKPPARYLLEDGELPGLVPGLEIVRYEEGWLAEGRHDALLVARRPPDSPRTL